MELRHLRYFVAVAEELHFGRAAARLGMSQPALSQQIFQLEARLGVRILNRTRRHVALRPEGLLLLEYARAILAQVDECMAALAGIAGRDAIVFDGQAVERAAGDNAGPEPVQDLARAR